MNWKLMRELANLIKEFEKNRDQNGGKRDFESFIEWIKEVVWEEF